MKRPVVLVVLDGWGIGPRDNSNPIYTAHPKTIEYISQNFPWGAMQASGIAAGLPWGEEGNSEVGHLTMGAGKVIYQHYPRISLSIKDKSFFNNQTILDAIAHAKQHGTKVNLIGLIGEANVHSSREHLQALLEMLLKENVPYSLHLFTDGRDSAPQSAWEFLSQIPLENIGSISGRYYGMDRDKHWNLTQQSYQAIIGQGTLLQPQDIEDHLQKTYAKNLNDEYIPPVTIGSPEHGVKNGDSIFIFNFREDRVRQIGEAFINKEFSSFPIQKFDDIYIASMTVIREDFNIPVAFPPQTVTAPLGKVIADQGKTQLRIAETQKYAHVTFFFNGLNDSPFPNEYRVLVPSRVVSKQDDDPEMMAPAITTRLVSAIAEESFDFILANYANADMVAHSGDYQATEKAITIVDQQLEKVLTTVLEHNAILIVTSDHGNAERLRNPRTGEAETKHDSSPVPFYLIAKEYMRPRTPQQVAQEERFGIGMLSDVAPTVLALMGIEKSQDMTGQNLLSQLSL